MMKIVFLDIDGVLNSRQSLPLDAGSMHPPLISKLNRLLQETGANVVISSSWRMHTPLNELANYLVKSGFEYPERIIGATRYLDGRRSRGYEITLWLRQVKGCVDSFVVLDDVAAGLDEVNGNVVVTDNRIGLSDKNVENAIKILNEGNA